MSDDDLHLTKYNTSHRQGRERSEEGHVDVADGKVKKWQGHYHVYLAKSDGTKTRSHRKRIIGLCSEMTKAEAREEHRTWLRQNILKQPAANSGTRLVNSLCDDYLKMKESDWDEITAGNIGSLFTHIIKPVIGDCPIGRVTPDDLRQLMAGLPKRIWRTPTGKPRRGTSDSYAKKAVTHLRAIFDLAGERGLISKNPARSITIRLKVPKGVTKPSKMIFPPEHLSAFLANLDVQDRHIVNVSFLGGTRPNETFALIGKNVGPDWLLINRALDRRRQVKAPKDDEARFVYIPPATMRDLHQWIANNSIGPNDLVFQNQAGKAISRNNFLKRNLRRAAKQTGIQDIQGVDFQMLRRSFSTLAKVIGMDVKGVQMQLGHRRPDMTMLEYIQPVDAARIDGLKKMEEILRGEVKLSPDAWAKLGTENIQ